MTTTTRKARSLTAALITFGSLVGGANAALSLYTSRSSWETRVAELSYSVTTEDFSTVPSDIVLDATNPFDESTQTISFEFDPYFSAGLTAEAIISSSGENVTLLPDGNNGLAMSGMIDLGGGAVTSPVNAIGFDYDISAAPGGWNVAINAPGGSAFLGDGDATAALAPGPVTGFIGWIDEDSASIMNIAIVNAVVGGSSAEIDNVSFAVQSVPEPSSTLLLGLSCLSLAFRRSRH